MHGYIAGTLIKNLRVFIQLKLFLIPILAISYGLLFLNTNFGLALEYNNFTSDRYQLQFEYPADWDFSEKETVTEFGPAINSSGDTRIFGTGVFSGVLSGNSIETTSLEEMVHQEVEVFQDVMSWKVVEKPNIGKYVIGGEKSATVVFEHEDDDGQSIVDLYVYVDHNGKRYFFDFTFPKDSFYNEENEDVRNRILTSIVFTDSINNTSQNATNASNILANSELVYKTYNNEDRGFSIEYPVNWTLKENDYGVSISKGTQEFGEFNVDIFDQNRIKATCEGLSQTRNCEAMFEYFPYYTTKEYSEDFVLTKINVKDNVKLIESLEGGKYKINNEDAMTFLYSESGKKNRVVSLMHDGTGYEFAYSSFEHNFDNELKMIDEMLNSIKFKN